MDTPRCTRALPDRPPGQPALAAPWAIGVEREASAPTIPDRCYRLWVALNGASCDFDDCVFALADTLCGPGWMGPPADLFADLTRAWDNIERWSWQVVRVAAVDVFFDLRCGECYEPSRRDWRTEDELIDDVLLPDGECAACAVGLANPTEHRAAARWAALRHLSWATIGDKIAELAAVGPPENDISGQGQGLDR